jgi:hypothetical protein
MFHYTVKNVIGEGEWTLVCYACLPRLRSAGYDVQQHDGNKDDKCALCGKSTLPATHGKRGLSAPGGKSLPFEDHIAA